MSKSTVTFKMDTSEAAHLLAAFADLPRVLQNTVRNQAMMVAHSETSRLQAAARASGKQPALIAPSITAKEVGGFPAISAGGSSKIPGKDARYSDVLFGAEFGGGHTLATMQFRPHKGKQGYWLFPTLRDDMDELVAAMEVAVDQAEQTVGLI